VSGLERVFAAKIAVTAFFWAAPLLFLPEAQLGAAGLPGEGVPLARLLGCAFVALCVGYGFGLREVRAGGRATSAVVVGIVSNASAGAYLVYFGASGALMGWHQAVRILAWASAAVTLGIAFALYWYGLRGGADGGRVKI
jgi:hypothetical protein